MTSRRNRDGENPLEYVPDQAGPVLDGGDHVPAHDEVVFPIADPRALDVVDFEFDVGRDPFLDYVSKRILKLSWS